MKIAVRDGRMVEFRKVLPPGLSYDLLGESVGFFTFDSAMAAEISRQCQRYADEGLGDAPHEEALRDVLLANPDRFGFENITGLPWLEIDFAEDIERAREIVLPAMMGRAS